MATVLISFGGSVVAGIISSLLTIYLAPRARHVFWSRERITELRLATYDKVNGLTAAIYMLEPSDSPFRNDETRLKELHTSLMAADDEVKNRFSEAAVLAFEKLQALVESGGLPRAKRISYAAARDEALRHLHAESLGF
jgi:hypothetical protein